MLGLAVIGVLAAVLVRYPGPCRLRSSHWRRFGSLSTSGAHKRFFIGLGEAGALGRLVPLYVVLAAAAAALVWRLLRGEQPRRCP